MNSVEYAEKVLDVHGPWIEAQERLKAHGEALHRVTIFKDHMRQHKAKLAERELEIRTEAPSWAGYPDGVTSRREWVKLLIENDSDRNAILEAIADCQSSLEDSQADVKHHEAGLSVLSARLAELGGLLHFYGAAKEAETASKHVNTPTQGEKST